jgi:hypothetical protein
MGLFSFVGDIGNKIFGSGDDDVAEKIKLNIEENNPGVSGLEVSFDDGTVCLSGACDSAAAKEKTVLIAGNMKGVTAVNGDGLTAPAAEVEVEYYTIVSGDTLWALSSKFLGDGNKYMEIFEANREVIQDPDKIFVGQVIRIPAS